MEYRQFLKYSETFLILSSYATCKRTTSHSITLIGFREKKRKTWKEKKYTIYVFSTGNQDESCTSEKNIKHRSWRNQLIHIKQMREWYFQLIGRLCLTRSSIFFLVLFKERIYLGWDFILFLSFPRFIEV